MKASVARKIGPSHGSISGLYPFRGETPVAYESTLERDFLRRCEFFPGVLGVESQPCQIPFQSPKTGRWHTYTPDYLVHAKVWIGRQEPRPSLLVEVKPAAKWRAHWREWTPKWIAARRYAREHGWLFRIQDEARIRDTILANIQFLGRYRLGDYCDYDSAAICQHVKKKGSVTVNRLLDQFFGGIYRPQGISLLWHLMATQQLVCDMSQPLCMITDVWVDDDE